MKIRERERERERERKKKGRLIDLAERLSELYTKKMEKENGVRLRNKI